MAVARRAPAAPTTAPGGCCWRRAGAHSSRGPGGAGDGRRRRRRRRPTTRGRLSRDRRSGRRVDALDPADRERLFAIVATCGTTNAGVIDDLAGAAATAAELGTWFHVDGAYGGAALAAPSVRRRFDGVERADSFIVDPHKWLFAPFDSCALLYRDPEIGRHAHTQHAEYLDVLHGEDDEYEWNASDYAHHLTRRARGLPLWFSLATHGTEAYTDAIETHAARHPRGRRARRGRRRTSS